MLAMVRTAPTVSAVHQPHSPPVVISRLHVRSFTYGAAAGHFARPLPATRAAARYNVSSGDDKTGSTSASQGPEGDVDVCSGSGSGSGSGGRSGDRGGGGGRSGGGDREGDSGRRRPVSLFRIAAARLLAAFLSYVAAVVGAGAIWDAFFDATLPQVDMSGAAVSVIIPALNEERIIAETVRHVRQELDPVPYEVIVVDGGSTDGTVEAARRAGATVIRSRGRGRGVQMNAGAEAAGGEVLLFLHADTQLPRDALAQVRQALSCSRTVLVGFRPLILDQGRPMWFSTLNNLTKTWYGPVLLRPASFVRGLRVVFGDQALSCRASDLRAVGGYRSDIPFMEDAELCIAMHTAGPADKSAHQGRGRVRMLLHRPAATSGRRIAAWGEARANAVFAQICLMWLAGASPEQMHDAYRRLYQDVR